jgi:hypothetical protein
MSSSSRRRVIAGLGLLALGGCFRPMLAEDDEARALRHRIAMPAVDTRFGHYLVESLEDRLGEPQDPAFALTAAPVLSEQGIVITQDDAVTRFTLRARAAWSLRRIGATEALIADVAFSQSGYDATTSLFATRQTRLAVQRRLAQDLGQRIARAIYARADDLAA